MEKSQELLFQPLTTHPAWEKQILPLLQKLKQEAVPNKELIPFLLELQQYGWKRQMPKLKGKKSVIHLKALEYLYFKQLGVIVKDLATFLIAYNPGQIPLILSQIDKQVKISKKDLLYLNVLLFFGLVPRQLYDNNKDFHSRFHFINSFAHLLSFNEFKTSCLIEYFKTTLKLIQSQNQLEEFFIHRNASTLRLYQLLQIYGETQLSKIQIASDQSSIEQYNGQNKVDFANRFIGGGCLKDGCVQEEIMFAIRPQLYATTLLCQKMDDNEALAFRGFRYYFNYKGYGNTTQYIGPAEGKYHFFELQNSKIYDENIIAIDAVKFKKGDPSQFSQPAINRELLKAYTGFNALKNQSKIITGGWGCGVYNGDFHTKVIIQWIAASMAQKSIVICPFGRKKSLQQMNFVETLKNLNVNQVYKLLLTAGKWKIEDRLKDGVFQIMKTLIKHKPMK